MIIKFEKPWSTYLKGQTVDCEDGVASGLIAEGVAVADGPVVERAVSEPAVERAVLNPPEKRRGRPKRGPVSQSHEAD